MYGVVLIFPVAQWVVWDADAAEADGKQSDGSRSVVSACFEYCGCCVAVLG